MPYREIQGGGPPRDGIPPIDNPAIASARAADGWLAEAEPVIAVEHRGQARAYPLQIMIFHEVVNDELGGTPVAVTFCPLCYSAAVFERPMVDGERLSFGTTGNLRHCNLVMWDRQTESWWQQFDGTAIVGEQTGSELVELPAAIVSWADFAASYRSGDVLSRETGHDRPYGHNPYEGYDDVRARPFLEGEEPEPELAPMEHVVGIEVEDERRAHAYSTLTEQLVLSERLGGEPIAIFWKPGMTSALHAARIADGLDIGATAVFSRTLGPHTLSFEPAAEGLFRDQQTGSVWNILGLAVSGPLAGQRLTLLPHRDVFWFAWSAFVPGVRLDEP